MQDISQIVHKIVLGWGCLPNPYCLDKHEACEYDGKICIACFTACASHVLPLDVFSFQTQHPQLFTIEWQRKLHVHAFIIVVIHVIHLVALHRITCNNYMCITLPEVRNLFENGPGEGLVGGVGERELQCKVQPATVRSTGHRRR